MNCIDVYIVTKKTKHNVLKKGISVLTMHVLNCIQLHMKALLHSTQNKFISCKR